MLARGSLVTAVGPPLPATGYLVTARAPPGSATGHSVSARWSPVQVKSSPYRAWRSIQSLRLHGTGTHTRSEEEMKGLSGPIPAPSGTMTAIPYLGTILRKEFFLKVISMYVFNARRPRDPVQKSGRIFLM